MVWTADGRNLPVLRRRESFGQWLEQVVAVAWQSASNELTVSSDDCD